MTGHSRFFAYKKISRFLLLALCLSLPAKYAAAAEYVLRFSHWTPATHVIQRTVETWAAAVEKASNGRIDVQIYPAQQLGAAKDHYTMASLGIVDAAFIAPGYTPGRFPMITAAEVPFLVNSNVAGPASVAFDGWYRKYAPAEMSEVRYCLSMMQEPGVLHSARPLKSLDDFKGLKLRVATAALGGYFGQIGAAPISLPAPEVRGAAAKGVIDAVTYGWKTAQALGVNEVFKNHLDFPIYSLATSFVVSKKFYDKLPDDLKAVIDGVCSPEWAGKLGAIWGAWEASGRDAAKKDGGQNIYPAPKALQDGLKAVAAGSLAKWKKDAAASGGDVDAAWQDLRKALADKGALLQ